MLQNLLQPGGFFTLCTRPRFSLPSACTPSLRRFRLQLAARHARKALSRATPAITVQTPAS
jgi:hypothetical protein